MVARSLPAFGGDTESLFLMPDRFGGVWPILSVVKAGAERKAGANVGEVNG